MPRTSSTIDRGDAVPAVEVFEEIDWSPKPVLRPGMDFHDRTAYYSTPLVRNVMKPGKGKGAPPVPTKETQTYVVTSEHEGFFYDKESLALEGFVPASQVYQEQVPRWSLTSTKAFLDGAAPSVNTQTAYATLRGTYETYVEFADEMSYDLMALFNLYTYVFRLFGSTGYIHFHGTAASGKSRNLSILNAVGFNTLWASSMSAASMYRKLSGSPGTTCIDESEGFDGERGEELRRILNAGYKDGAKVVRTEKQDEKFVPIEYDVFGPKALASINPLEPVIASRCVVINMRPALRDLADFDGSDGRWQAVRDSLYLWAMANAASIAALVDEWRTEKKQRLAPRLIGRQWETTQQFIVLADHVGGEAFAEKIIAHFNVYFAKQQQAADALDRLRTTLRALPRVLNTKAAHAGHMYSAKDIHEVISSFMEEDAKEYFKTKHVIKNLDTIGFRNKARASGGVRIEITEAALRGELRQRRVDPYPEDTEWLAGTVSYQNQPTTHAEEVDPWWERTEDQAPSSSGSSAQTSAPSTDESDG